MSIKLLPASVNPIDPSPAPHTTTGVPRDVTHGATTSLVPLTPRAIATQAGQNSLAPPADAFSRSGFSWPASSWPSSTRQGHAKFIHGTLVEDPQSDETEHSGGEYLSPAGWAWSQSVGSTAAAHYLFYAASPARWSARLLDLFA